MLFYLQNSPAWLRLVSKILLTTIFTALSYTTALYLRFEGAPDEIFIANRFEVPLLFLILYRLLAYAYWDINRAYWRYISTHDAVLILKAHIVSSLVFTATFGWFRFAGYPRSVILIELTLSLLLVGGIRFFARMYAEQASSTLRRGNSNIRNVVVLGAGDSGHLLVKNLMDRRMAYEPVAVLDDSKRLIGTSVHGVQVLGPISDLPNLVERHPEISAVILAIPSLSTTRINQIDGLCRANNLVLKRLQTFEDLACLDVSDDENEISIEGMLQRESNIEHEEEIRTELSGKVVLITGAGGSIGSELVRQVAPFEPKKIILVDHSEFNLFSIDREIKDKFPNCIRVPMLSSICDATRMNSIFSQYKPEVVFHAAAYKHVPLMELNCYEAFKTNVIGTRNVLEAAITSGTKRFVLVSTDKAVDPSSVMGASKRITEMLVQQSAFEDSSMKTAAVRFGNVINSAGSVVPIFKQQIATGGPLTVTHPEMERYFMSIREAVKLILTAGMLGEAGEIFMLDMGTPIKIVDVAKKMLALYGRKDIPIVFTGIRPGEKLTEVLFSFLEIQSSTRFEKVNRVTRSTKSSLNISKEIKLILDRIETLKDQEIGSTLLTLAGKEFLAEDSLPTEVSNI
ncbi:MAG: nucleoside-diphosphate sugar epimerase/dehydratase [Bdellovibrionota bacterium]